MSDTKGIELTISDDEPGETVAYLKLPGKGTHGAVTKTVRLRDVLGDYSGPDLYFDFDENNVLIGVEVLE